MLLKHWHQFFIQNDTVLYSLQRFVLFSVFILQIFFSLQNNPVLFLYTKRRTPHESGDRNFLLMVCDHTSVEKTDRFFGVTMILELHKKNHLQRNNLYLKCLSVLFFKFSVQ